ncbi:MAG: hypothetical protein ACI82E_000200, partial [Nonlabens sp.]
MKHSENFTILKAYLKSISHGNQELYGEKSSYNWSCPTTISSKGLHDSQVDHF